MKTFGDALAPPASPPPTPLVEDNEIFKKFLFSYTVYTYIEGAPFKVSAKGLMQP